MQFIVICFFVSLAATLFVVRTSASHSRVSGDSDLSGPQKFHTRVVPRIGGAAIILASLAGLLTAYFQGRTYWREIALLLIAGSPAFLAGFIEDLTKKVGVLARLCATMVAGLVAALILGAVVQRTGIDWIDAMLLSVPLISIAVTCFAVAGLANAINIIDGFNGLSSMVAILMFGSIGYISIQTGDALVLGISLIMIGSIAGFFVWNYPAGLIFLGDGGAYFIGFMLAESVILLVLRNPAVSPWYAVLLFSYPIFETLFSVYRRVIVRRVSPGSPDGVHLHSIIYRRVLRWMIADSENLGSTLRNSMTSPYLWLLSGMAIFPASIFWANSYILFAFVLGFCFSYVWLYRKIIRFKTPKWIVFHLK
jgi:UDP-N-acetylmuramyl pentapeptide phosphotransferase/UDP-N-acetylglucosamine-1-phosphate transferase